MTQNVTSFNVFLLPNICLKWYQQIKKFKITKNSKNTIHLLLLSMTVKGGHIIQLEQVAILKFIFCITQEYLRKVVGR